jgi:uncharacterized protein (TIGR02271 family)
MIVDTDREEIDSIVLDNGQQMPAGTFEIEDGVVYAGAITSSDTRAVEAPPSPQGPLDAPGLPPVATGAVGRRRLAEASRIERRSVQGGTGSTGSADAAPLGESIRVPIREEQVNVTKTPRVVEEIEISTVPREETRTVSDTVRREEIRVDQSGDVDRRG